MTSSFLPSVSLQKYSHVKKVFNSWTLLDTYWQSLFPEVPVGYKVVLRENAQPCLDPPKTPDELESCIGSESVHTIRRE